MILNNLVNHSLKYNSLVHQNLYSIVIGYQKKRSMFDKTTYHPDWIPRNKLYSKHRKPRQQGWTDQNTFYPVLIPPMFKSVHPKSYVKNVIEQQQRIKSFRKKEFLLQDIRAGDIIEITYQQTYQSDKVAIYKCLLLGFRRKNSLTASLQVAIRFGGMSLKAIFLIHSPKVKKIKLISKGSGNLKSNIKFRWRKFGKQKLLSPRIKRGVIKKRGKALKKRKIKQRVVIFDRPKSDSFKRLV